MLTMCQTDKPEIAATPNPFPNVTSKVFGPLSIYPLSPSLIPFCVILKINEELLLQLLLLLLLLLLHVVNVKIIFFQKKIIKRKQLCGKRLYVSIRHHCSSQLHDKKIDNEDISFVFYLLLRYGI